MYRTAKPNDAKHGPPPPTSTLQLTELRKCLGEDIRLVKEEKDDGGEAAHDDVVLQSRVHCVPVAEKSN
jgi:hypothetical protein